MKIIFCNNNLYGFVAFRKDIAYHFAQLGHEVILLYPRSTHEDYYVKKLDGFCRCVAIDFEPTGQNLQKDFNYYRTLRQIYKQERPDIVFNYTIKPNIYSARAAHSLNIPVVNMMAGLGRVFQGDTFRKRIARRLYKWGLDAANKVIVLNQHSYDTVVDKYVDKDKLVLFPGGEGVNMEDYPYKTNHFYQVRFLMVARLLYDKGYQEFVDAARIVKHKYPDVKFEILGDLDETSPNSVPKTVIEHDVDLGYIEYLGCTNDVPSYVLRDGVVVVVASYYLEGMNRALMEACSMGRPIITTNMPGCREMVDDSVNGYCIEPQNATSLAEVCIKFLNLTEEEKQQMAIRSNAKCKSAFDVNAVISEYDRIVAEIVS